MKQQQTILERIKEIETEYLETTKTPASLHSLQDLSDELAVQVSSLQEIRVQKYQAWKISETKYQIKIESYRGSKIRAKTTEDAKALARKMVNDEVAYRTIQWKTEGAEGTLRTMNQRISQIRKEWEQDHLVKAVEGKIEDLDKRVKRLET